MKSRPRVIVASDSYWPCRVVSHICWYPILSNSPMTVPVVMLPYAKLENILSNSFLQPLWVWEDCCTRDNNKMQKNMFAERLQVNTVRTYCYVEFYRHGMEWSWYIHVAISCLCFTTRDKKMQLIFQEDWFNYFRYFTTVVNPDCSSTSLCLQGALIVLWHDCIKLLSLKYFVMVFKYFVMVFARFLFCVMFVRSMYAYCIL